MVAFNVPPSIESVLLRAFGGDLNRAALEALAIESYRSAKLTAGEVATLVGLETSIQAQDWLAKRGVAINYSLADLEDDRAALAKLSATPPL
jgi:predicted HTH domain antitoxin